LSLSKENLFNGNYLSITGEISGKFSFLEFNDINLNLKSVSSQRLLRKISNPTNESDVYQTNYGTTGIFINGVELLNYKSKDKIFYGPIESINVSSGGEGYDVINPPEVNILDTLGTGCVAHCSVVGVLERIDILDEGFDYLDPPVITITGGNGVGASAEANLGQFEHSTSFNSENISLLDFTNNVIGFNTYHKFRNYERVIYQTFGQTSLSGLTTNSEYVVKTIGISSIQLFKSLDDAILGINTISFSSSGKGVHEFKSTKKKNKIKSISIKNSGSGYSNKKRTTLPIGINTASNTININNHGYLDGEIVRYDATGISISGLSSGTSYYLKKIDNDNFKLSKIGITTEQKDYFYKTNQFINLSSIGSGYHIFNYPPIEVKISGKIGIQTHPGQNFNAVIKPVFRGKVEDIFVEFGGTSYGTDEIINYNRQPSISLSFGSGAEITPIVSQNGSIVDIIVQSGGSGYNSQPNIVVSGSGSGAVLVPIISNGSIKDVKIISGGGGYSQNNIAVSIISSGSGFNYDAKIKSWTINLLERVLGDNARISNEGGVLSNSNFGLKYTHMYAPETLRSISYREISDGLLISDIENDNSNDNLYHSPIIGWSYDGNPIYGPYGYSSPSGSSGVKLLKSGYKLDIKENRPISYPPGFFVEDYDFFATGDLDENNGRFCITPEFPAGTYAYFCTLNESKNPEFPYVIGNTYKSKPIDFNFELLSNDQYIDLNKTDWIRNTTPYNLLNKRSGYDYILDISNNKISTISNILVGSISSIAVISEGNNYKVNDEVIFNGNENKTKCYVSEIKGKKVSQIGVSLTSFENVELFPQQQGSYFLGFCEVPHGLKNNDIISISGSYEFNKVSPITINQNILVLTSGIGTTGNTGIVTYFGVSGILDYPNIRENDIYNIFGEDVKILNIDKESSRIKVLRNRNNISGISSYSAGSLLTEKTRKFKVNLGITSSFYNYVPNTEFYFDPQESLAKGTSGITSTLYFSNPGSGVTSTTIPIKTIYLPNHNLQTGTKLIYSNNGGNSISVSTNTTSSFTLNDNSIVYAVRINNNLIGISTDKVGINSNGNYIAIGTSSSSADTLYFVGSGNGSYHSLKTDYLDNLSVEILNSQVTVSTASSHGLNLKDTVKVSIKSGITTTVVVKYDDYHRRLLINPKQIEDIDLIEDTLTITNHGYSTGDKIVYSAISPIGGLNNKGIYYIVSVSKNKFKLVNTFFDSQKQLVDAINLTALGTGTVSSINPPLNFINGQTIVFDLSDSSLSYTSSSTKPAFDFNLYTDSQFKNKFEFSGLSQVSEVTKEGIIGIDATAKLTISTTNNLPKKLYYNLTPINLDNNLETKIEIISDNEQQNNNIITFGESNYSGEYIISGITTNTFQYSLSNISSNEGNYTPSNSIINYTTTSLSAFGGVEKIVDRDKNKKYNTIPPISEINTNTGTNLLVDAVSSNIGRINKTKLNDIGYDYPSDLTIRPKAKIPQVLKLESLSIFESIGVTSTGINYNSPPDLVVIDSLTNQIVDDVELQYILGENNVTIVKNTAGIGNLPPIIIPTNNSNGVGINSISYDEITKDVTIIINGTYLNESQFPFDVGDEILVENVNVISGSGKGYNSENYNYEFFTVKTITINPGITTNPSITYNIADVIESDLPGTYDNTFISGSVVPVKNLATFKSVLTRFPYLIGEEVVSKESRGIVEHWDSDNSYLTILSSDDFEVGSSIFGKISNTLNSISKIYKTDNIFYEVSSSSVNKYGWETETGFLNNDLQRIHDNDYYQYFSYSLKSEVQLNDWDEIVSNLNHTSGFKKFSNLIVDSNTGILTASNITTQDSDISSFAEIDSFVDVNCVFDFDSVAEISVQFPDRYKSNQLYIQNTLLKDYFEMIGNRVLILDDISDIFDSSRQDFEITTNNYPIFKREFVGSAVSISDNIINIPNHFFVTGEEIVYISPTDGTGIGIATTSIAGIGLTDLLPPKIYIVKDSEFGVRISASASESLLAIPTVLQISDVGTGTTHTFLSKKQNTRALITIDGIIQSPIVSTSVTTSTTSTISIGTDLIPIIGVSSIFAGNYIKIDNEIMKVLSSDNNQISVIRNTLGTGLTSHDSGSLVTKIKGNYNIIENTLYFTEPPIGKTPIETSLPDELDFVGIVTNSSFSGRVFLRSGIIDTNNETYETNYVFDDISSQFDGLNKSFELKYEGQSISGFSTGNSIITINNVLQTPNGFNVTGDYSLEENLGISTINFTGTASSVSYDTNTANLPRGGIIVSVGSTQGFGYQPLVSAGGTAIVSSAGTIQSISIGNSGSGYRSGIQNIINVGVKTYNNGVQNIEFIGIASVLNGNVVSVNITNPGLGYTTSSPPTVVFDSPLSYSNIPLVYSSISSGVGTGAKVDIIVGQGSSVISFELTNFGYGYENGDILTVSIGGTTGIPTTGNSYEEFNLTVDQIFTDDFSGWYPGDFEVFDPLDNYFNGSRKSFPIRLNNVPTTIASKKGSNLNPESAILLFINDVLQIPGNGYRFDGSIITFDEPPRGTTGEETGDKSKILFYKGTSSIDVIFKNSIETIKIGDTVQLSGDDLRYKQDKRQVMDIKSPVIIETNVYSGPGINTDSSYLRPINWCRQTSDKFIGGLEVTKNRELYEPLIYPATNIILGVSTESNEIFVESVKTFFDNQREGPTYDVILQSQDQKVGAVANAILTGDQVSSIEITNPGKGYVTSPTITIASPTGIGSTAIAFATVSDGSVSGPITPVDFGSGYTNIPEVIISTPDPIAEFIEDVSYEGDFGIITGIQTSTYGGSNALIFDLYIPNNSYLKDVSVVGTAFTVSEIKENYYFVVSNSNISGVSTSKTVSGNTIGTSNYIDNVYQVASVSIGSTFVPGETGLVDVAKVTVKVDYPNSIGVGYSNYYGNYSWGRIYNFKRRDKSPKSFDAYNENGYLGISSSPILYRYSPLKYQDYNS